MSWMTQTEAAAALGCSNRTIRRRIRAGMLKTRREGRNILVDVDIDHAVATVTQVGRQLAEVGAAAAIQKKHDADTVSAMQATFADTLNALSASRDVMERQTLASRRSARTGWMTATILVIALFAGGWYYSLEGFKHADELHTLQSAMGDAQAKAETAMISAEVRHVGEMATTQARHEARAQTMDESLAYERQRLAGFEEQNAALNHTLIEQAARLESAVAARARLADDQKRLQTNLRQATAAANITRTLKGVWAAARSTLRPLPDPGQIRALRQELAATQSRHPRELEAAQAQHEKDLAAARAHHDGESQILNASLAHERESVKQLEQRVDALTDKLVTVVVERGRLQMERQQLVDELLHLQGQLQAARLAVDLSAKVRAWWSTLRTAQKPAEPDAPPQQLSANR